jgi:hypothetical protein
LKIFPGKVFRKSSSAIKAVPKFLNMFLVNQNSRAKFEYMANIKKKIISQLFSRRLHKWMLLLFIFFVSLSVYFTLLFLTNNTLHTDENKPFSKSNIIVDGKPFFPFGFYYYYYNSLTPTHRTKALHEIADAGFNTLVLFWDKLDDYNQFLDDAKRLGVYVITDLEDTNSPFAVVDQFKDKSAVLGWFIADDVGVPGRASNVKIFDFHRQVKTHDPEHFTYASVGEPKKFPDYAHVADLIGCQIYPIRKKRPDLFGEVNNVLNSVRPVSDERDRLLIANLQTFSWQGDRWPTAAEVYNMTYQALLAGVKGIILYTYLDEENYIREEPEVWNMAKSLVPEINKLRPILLSGSLRKIDTQIDNVLAGQWTYGSSVYVVILNTSLTETTKVSITIPAKVTGSLKPLFHNRPSGMVLKSGKLTGSLKPKDVHIYELSQN